jgi:hypothetical protein
VGVGDVFVVFEFGRLVVLVGVKEVVEFRVKVGKLDEDELAVELRIDVGKLIEDGLVVELRVKVGKLVEGSLVVGPTEDVESRVKLGKLDEDSEEDKALLEADELLAVELGGGELVGGVKVTKVVSTTVLVGNVTCFMLNM